MPEFNITIFILGCVGGLLPDILRIIKNRYNKNVSPYYRRPQFWIGLVFLVAAGGLVAWVLEAESVKNALIYGFSAPELISKLFSVSPSWEQEPTIKGSDQFNLRRWWGM